MSRSPFEKKKKKSLSVPTKIPAFHEKIPLEMYLQFAHATKNNHYTAKNGPITSAAVILKYIIKILGAKNKTWNYKVGSTYTYNILCLRGDFFLFFKFINISLSPERLNNPSTLKVCCKTAFFHILVNFFKNFCRTKRKRLFCQLHVPSSIIQNSSIYRFLKKL